MSGNRDYTPECDLALIDHEAARVARRNAGRFTDDTIDISHRAARPPDDVDVAASGKVEKRRRRRSAEAPAMRRAPNLLQSGASSGTCGHLPSERHGLVVRGGANRCCSRTDGTVRARVPVPVGRWTVLALPRRSARPAFSRTGDCLRVAEQSRSAGAADEPLVARLSRNYRVVRRVQDHSGMAQNFIGCGAPG